ncbi:ABC transporter substrate-binding protein [Reyranella sp.]|uniref:ABC transporter substrate-binding protein n=1 Tax=Reyranella sp. TaxID=1929291 RepID=UPI0012249EF8|nr:ABC transporter substrate-binding protein [Reyranella sp.]TAJ85871.1 MAG: ABC transporter substrate-binding protein [Reyranella sp.]
MRRVKGALAAAAAVLFSASVEAQTLKVVMHSDVKIVDPIWTTAYIVRNHGYMIYDTLLAVDDKLAVKPQMLESWKVSDDKLTYTFTLRDGLKFHDGAAVTAEDCIASIKRWASRDAMGQKLMGSVKSMTAVDPKTFTLVLNEPYGLVIESLGKPSSNVPFIMPKRVAETPGNTQITDFTGSGPFVFRRDLWRPGEKAVYDKFKDYKPRAEPPSALSGGKNVYLDRVEWVNIPDPQTAANALLTGEIDMIEQPLIELLPMFEKDKNIEIVDYNPLGSQYSLRFNVLHKPFDNARIRQAVLYALNQKDFLLAGINDPKYFKECKALFICGTPYATDKGFEDKLTSNFAKSKEILKQEGYDGTPVVLLYATDTNTGRLTPVAKSLLERGGFVVDMQAMDWQTVLSRRSRKEPLNAGGWSGFMTSWVSADLLDPIVSAFVGAACDKAAIGWPCDAKLEELRDAFAKTTDPAKRKEYAEAVQVRESEYPTLAHLGQFNIPVAKRTTVTGNLISPAPVFWNVRKAQ